MLQLKGIRKKYKTGNFVQTALDGVDLTFRDNEFVAILGPSGSGKTTMLNIIGGLDRYDDGDLIINGISTKNYNDRRWDAYRNHTIGFVFQSYNLISHQTILANVELALTISGISKRERKKRAMDALEQVGLKDHAKKRPNQLSGGQMQRVAIARALVNDPDILLADEPTGALDSVTSVQVMDLLKEVAKDRLVVMVTHNPELADKYATRIVKLSDGKIISDSDAPSSVAEKQVDTNNKKLGKASMSFATALGLSLNNLLTKKARTILISFAGSIGIIGIALILSLSNGVNEYIKNIEEDTLSEYPLQIVKTNVDFSSMLTTAQDSFNKKKGDKPVRERKTITNTLSNTKTNDLVSFKKDIEANKDEYLKYAKFVEYSYNIAPLIYCDNKYGVRQVNPDTSYAAAGYNSASLNSMTSMGISMDSFYKLPDEKKLYESQYDIKAGRWPTKANELVVVLSGKGAIMDTTLYALGLKDPKELEDAVSNYINGKEVKIKSKITTYNYKDFIGLKYKLVNGFECYKYDKKYKVWANKKDDKKFMDKLLAKSKDIEIVGVVKPKKYAKVNMLKQGVAYRSDMINEIIETASKSQIVKDQLKNRDVNVFTGKKFDEKGTNVDLKNMFALNPDALSKAFSVSEKTLDMGDMDLGSSMMNSDEIKNMMKGSSSKEAAKKMQKMFTDLMNGYSKYASKGGDPMSAYLDGYTKYLGSDGAKETIAKSMAADMKNATSIDNDKITTLFNTIGAGFEQYLVDNKLTDTSKTNEYFNDYMQTDDAKSTFLSGLFGITKFDYSKMDMASLMKKLNEGYASYAKKNNMTSQNSMADSFGKYMKTKEATKILEKGMSSSMNLEDMQEKIASSMSSAMKSVGEQISAKLKEAFKVDPKALSDAMKSSFDEKELKDLMSSLMSVEKATYETNLSTLGYADLAEPYEIEFFPKDFESKDKIADLIDAYNNKVKVKDKSKVITFTDMVGTMMSSVTDIVNAISYVLIAFVAISLIVSSIMIGVITYISVLERKKEIGVLRAMGASKRNISNVFNAETFIIGGLAGLFGIILTHLIMIPGNELISYLADGTDIKAFLPVTSALILILLSIILTLIGGIIPSKKASRQDPVIALRSE